MSFLVENALAAGDVVRITLPAGTTFVASLAANDLSVRQMESTATGPCPAGGASGVDTPPAAVAVAPAPAAGSGCLVPPSSGSGCPTLDVTLPAGLAWSSANGYGHLVLSTSATGGGKIRHPPTHDVVGAPGGYAVLIETRRGGATLDSGSVSGASALNVLPSADWAHHRQSPARAGLAPLTDLPTASLNTVQTIVVAGNRPIRSSPLAADLDGDGKMDLLVPTSVGNGQTSMTIAAYRRLGGPATALSLWWTYTVPVCAGATTGTVNMAVGDLTGDGVPEIALSANYVTEGGAVTGNCVRTSVISNTGTLLNTLGVAGGPCTSAAIHFAHTYPAIGDIDGVPGNELVVAYFTGTGAAIPLANQNTAGVLTYRFAGGTWSCAWDSFAAPNGVNGNRLQASPVLAELRANHPGLELLLGRTDGSGNGVLFLCQPTPTQPDVAGPSILSSCEQRSQPGGIWGVALGDMDGDGLREAVTGSVGFPSVSMSVFPGTALATDLTMAAVYTTLFPYSLVKPYADAAWSTPAVAAYSGGTGAEAILPNYSEYIDDPHTDGDINIRRFTGTGIAATGPPTVWARTATSTNIQSRGGGIAVDLVGDKRPEYVFASQDGNLFGTTIAAGTGAISTTPFMTQLFAGANLWAPPIAVDINGDCRVDVLQGDSLGNVRIIGDTTSSVPTAPAGIASLTAVPTGDPAHSASPDIRVTLSWSAPATGGAPITTYKVYRSTTPSFAPGPSTLLATLVAPTLPNAPLSAGAYVAPPTSYTDLTVKKSPDPGIRYYYKVAATNCIGEAPAGSEARADAIVPAAVTSLAALPSGDPAYPAPLQVRLTWTAPTSQTTPASPHFNTNCQWLEGYRVYRTGGGAPQTFTIAPGSPAVPWPRALPPPLTPLSNPNTLPPPTPLPSPTVTFIDSTGLARGNVYSYTVKAVNCVGESLGTNVTADVRVPSAPSLDSAPQPSGPPAYAGGLQVRLAWSAPSVLNGCVNGANPSGWLEGYRIYRTTAPTAVTAAPANLLVTITAGAAAESPPAAAPWPTALPPAPLSPAVAALTYIDTGAVAGFPLSLGQQYNYAITAVNCVGESLLSAPIVADVRLPAAPSGVTWLPSGPPAYSGGLQVRLAWSPPSPNNANCPWIEGYRVYRQDSGFGPYALMATLPGTPSWMPTARPLAGWGAPTLPPTSWVDTGATTPLAVGGTYSYRIVAVNCAGEDAAGTLVPVSLSLPGAPTALSGTPSATNVALSWSPPASLGSCGTAGSWTEGYRVYRTPATGGAPTLVGTVLPSGVPAWPRTPPALQPLVPAGAFTDPPSGSLPHGSYDYQVAAIGCTGEGPMSTVRRAHVGANLPPTLDAPAAMALPLGSTTLAFSSGTGTAIVGADADALAADRERVTASVSNGLLSLATMAGLDPSCPPFVGPPSAPSCSASGSGQASITFRGTLPALNAAMDGLIFDANGAACLPPAPIATLTVTLHDEGNNGFEGPAGARSVQVQVPIACSTAPAFSHLGDRTVLEDAGVVAVANWANGLAPGSGGSPTSLRFIVTNDNPGLFQVQPQVMPTTFTAGPWGPSALTFQPALDQCGMANVLVYLEDDGGNVGRINMSAGQPFRIFVTCVNDAPEFVPSQTVAYSGHDAGPIVLPWASGLVPARTTAGDELAGPGAQSLHFEVQVANPAIFSAPPTMWPGTFPTGPAAASELRYTPQLGQFGSSVVTICLVDDGGTANGGQDRACRDLLVYVLGTPRPEPDCFSTVGALEVVRPGVAANDRTTTGNPPVIVLATGPQRASSFELRSDGSFSYVPAPGFQGRDSFAYYAQEGPYRSGATTVCIDVVPPGTRLLPDAAFHWSPHPVHAGDRVTFRDASTDADGTIVDRSWEFGDGARASGSQVEHVFEREGTYSIVLSVRDDQGLPDVERIDVRVLPARQVVSAQDDVPAPAPPVAPPPPPPAPPPTGDGTGTGGSGGSGGSSGSDGSGSSGDAGLPGVDPPLVDGPADAGGSSDDGKAPGGGLSESSEGSVLASPWLIAALGALALAAGGGLVGYVVARRRGKPPA